MIFQLVNIRDYPHPLTSFAEARNYYLKQLKDGEYVLFVEEDEEVPEMLLSYIRSLRPDYPYYNIRRVNLFNNRHVPLWNPFYCGKLCSNRVRFVGSIHEVPWIFRETIGPDYHHLAYLDKPSRGEAGWIDIPTIHNQMPSDPSYPVGPGRISHVSPWYKTRIYRLLLVVLKLRDILRGW